LVASGQLERSVPALIVVRATWYISEKEDEEGSIVEEEAGTRVGMVYG
jgi:hypothetical protein